MSEKGAEETAEKTAERATESGAVDGTMATRRGQGPTWLKLAALVVSVGLTLCIAELGLSLLAPPDLLRKPFPNIDFLQVDPVLGWRTRPGFDADRVVFANRSYRTLLRTNSHGFRGEELRPRSDGTIRIVCIGDSVTFGLWRTESLGQPRFDSYVDELRERSERRGYGDVEVVNAGVLGYTSGHGLRQLLTELIALEPDVVTVRVGYNDHTRSWRPALRAIEPTSELARDLFLRLHRIRVLQLALSARQEIDLLHPPTQSVPWVDREQYARNLARFAEVAAQHGLRLLLMDYPLAPLESLRAGEVAPMVELAGAADIGEIYATHADYQQITARVAREQGVPLLDSSTAFSRANRPLFTGADFVHPIPWGAKLLGRTLFAELEELGWLGQPAVVD